MVLIQMLDELERILEQPVSEFFDLVAGTSTGGILALVLATGKYFRSITIPLLFWSLEKLGIGNLSLKDREINDFPLNFTYTPLHRYHRTGKIVDSREKCHGNIR